MGFEDAGSIPAASTKFYYMIKKNNRRPWKPYTRINYRIREEEVRVIASNGEQVGIMKTKDAVELAKKHGLDLVEISTKTNPHICKICDFGKHKYEEAKKKKKNTSTVKTKEIQLRPHCDQHDFDVKLNRAKDFLDNGMKVKIALRFRGRENAHKEFGFDIVKRFIKELESHGKSDTKLSLSGRNITAFIFPLPKKQR